MSYGRDFVLGDWADSFRTMIALNLFFFNDDILNRRINGIKKNLMIMFGKFSHLSFEPESKILIIESETGMS